MDSPSQFGSYQIVRKIGAGGMADVYEAVRVGLENFQTRVALKCILPTMTRDDRFVRMFVNEAHLGSQLHHPNIIQIQDFNKVQDTYYIAMEYVEGVDLSRIIKRLAFRGLSFPASVVIDLTLQALAGLGYAHEARRSDGSPMNVIHRDVKPSNFLITSSGMVKVGDFGIAKAANATHNLSLTGDALKGTINYMSPEQIDGAKLTAASDLFSVGAIIFELLTLRALFDGPTMSSILLKIAMVNIDGDLELVNSRYPEFVPVLRRALARLPDERYQNARILSTDLRKLREELGDGLSLREFLAMHMELFEPFGTQPGEQEDEERDPISMAVTPADLNRASIQLAAGEAHVNTLMMEGDDKEGPLPGAEEPDFSFLSEPAPVEEGAPRAGGPFSPAELGHPVAQEDLGSVAQQLLDFHDPETNPDLRVDRAQLFSAAATLPHEGTGASEEQTIAGAPRRQLWWVILLVVLGAGAVGAWLLTRGSEPVPGAVGSDLPRVSPPPVAVERVPESVQVAQLSLASTPTGARIRVGGETIAALTPTTLPLPEGRFSVLVRLELAGYRAFEQEVSYSPGQQVSLGPTLVPIEVTLKVDSIPPGARLFVDKEASGKLTPAVLTGLKPAQPLRIALRLSGYEPWIQDLSLSDQEDQQIMANLVRAGVQPVPQPVVRSPTVPTEPKPTPRPPPVAETRPPSSASIGVGTLILSTVPPDAEVYVNGQKRGQVPLTLQVSAGKHTVEFRALSGARKSTEVTVDPNAQKRLVWHIGDDRWMDR